ncbi:uncharacterized protein LOC142525330 isoform X1 [Primulina tabacum]|uniref:uncharacterized protein LOC142525330 isoform X1 n=1 Tax=Primulina tabacum TaxID=48773 RepID=UPI003F5977F3
MQARTGARIQVIPLHLPPGDTSKERTVQIDGTSEQIEAAKQLVNEVISERIADIFATSVYLYGMVDMESILCKNDPWVEIRFCCFIVEIIA